MLFRLDHNRELEVCISGLIIGVQFWLGLEFYDIYDFVFLCSAVDVRTEEIYAYGWFTDRSVRDIIKD